jgi:prepilin-type processing-associated H-X9-DG protein
MYASDYDDHACFGINLLLTDTRYELRSWYAYVYYDLSDFSTPYFNSEEGYLYPYMKNQQIYGCPESDSLLAGQLSPTFPNGFGVNENVMVPELTAWGIPIMPTPSLTSIDRPAETILIADSANIDTGSGTPTLSHQTWIDGPVLASPQTWAVHSKMVNVGWVDGHAKSRSVTIRPTLDLYYGDAVAMAGAKKFEVGDIMNPSYPYGNQWQNYYYQLDKPN